MALALPNEIKALLDGLNFVYLAALMPDASPRSTVWVGREDGHIPVRELMNRIERQAAPGRNGYRRTISARAGARCRFRSHPNDQVLDVFANRPAARGSTRT